MKKFLKAKHWQIFLLTIGIPFLLQIIMMIFMVSKLTSKTDQLPDMMMFGSAGILYIISFILFAASLLGWLWSISVGLQAYIPENIKMKITRFKVFFFYPMVYIAFFMFIFTTLFNQNAQPDVTFIAIIIPLHFFAMFCMFYILYFAAKVFKTAELQRKVTFSDFAGEFFLIWFFPIGVWIVQPKINKIIEGK